VSGEPRYRESGALLCLDCGSVIADREAHTRFHSILSAHAWALGVLKTSHLASHVHERYDVVERIDSKRFDSWTGEALAEVVRELNDEDPLA